MDQIEKVVICVGSYLMLFIAAIGLGIMRDLPMYFDVIVYIACIYIAWAREEILAYHVIGCHVTPTGKLPMKIMSHIIRIAIGIAYIKLMLMGFYQYVLVLFFIDYFTWVKTGRALTHVISLCSIERKVNESKA
ncbi:hypothetical protein RZE82_02500 [Mollicutes bacterium LVI A0039]|nr:hypothetical protein RZE82_02500 [Mollicutes bacterium LVI A0039]